MAGLLDLYPNDPARTALYNYENAPGLLSGLLGAYLGGTRGQLTGQAGQAQQQQQNTYDAAQRAGYPNPDMWALNPDIIKFQQELALKQQAQEQPKVVPFGSSLVKPNTGEAVFGGDTSNMLLDEETVKRMAEQYRSGDTTVMQNLGRGAQGAENIVKLRREIVRQNNEQGEGGAAQAMRNAEFFGVKSGQRTLGGKQANIELAANEFKQVLPIVVAASDAVNRTNYPDLNKIIQAYEEKTGDPNIVKFGSGVNTLVNLYARAISPTGAPTVSDKDHARVLLNRAWSQGQFKAAVDMMSQEIEAALKSPAKVREEMRTRFMEGQPGAATSMPAAPAAPQGGVVNWQTYFGGK